MNLIASKNKATRGRTGQSTQPHSLGDRGSRRRADVEPPRCLFSRSWPASFPEGLIRPTTTGLLGRCRCPAISRSNDAVTLALQQNRLVKTRRWEAQKYDFQVNTARSRRKPQFQFSMLGGEASNRSTLLSRKGAFGTFANTGRIPSDQCQSPHARGIHSTYSDRKHRSAVDTTVQDRSGNSCDGTWT